ncbi:MAG: toprim domain-containing protein, partial [Oscillospiraceae bacterium]|nr:toprim domain-containing protein [Oscillospiraceae bacterium]
SRRLVFPTGRNGYTVRSIDPETPEKYRYMKEGEAGYFNRKALQGNKPVYVVEGALDALSIAEAGCEACALGSTSGVDKFLGMLDRERPVVPLILSLDNDKAGKEAQTKLKAGLEARKISFYEINTSGEHKDPNEHLIADRVAFTALVNSDPAEAAGQEVEMERISYLETSAAYHINSLMGEIAASADTPAIQTGFNKLDDALGDGLYEGFYVLGAISSLGKTTFVLQVADQIAQRGHDVLIFSLEMSRFELMAKSISRLTFDNCAGNMKNAKTTRGILAGAKRKYYSPTEKELINKSIAAYGEYSERIYIHEGVGTIGTEQIKQEVQRHISFTGNTPVVVIDYLQIIAPFDMRATDKQNTDKAVLELKRLSRDKKIPVIAISSFNRDNYTAPVNLASFKESGAIEYSSDVLLGLQLAGMDELSQSEGKRADTIKRIEEKKAADPRKAQLKILKNRNGKIGLSLYYDYYPMFNTFKETAAQ